MGSPAPALPPRVRPKKRAPLRRRPRFSLWALMVAITAVALFLGALVGLPPEFAIFFGKLLSLAIFLAVLLGVIHGRGYLRTFCTGGLVAAAYYLVPELISARHEPDMALAQVAASLLRQQGHIVESPNIRAIVFLSSAVELICAVVSLGFFSVWIRRRIERRQARRR